MRRTLLAALLVLAATPAWADGTTYFRALDYLSPYVERAIQNGSTCSGGTNTYGISQARIASDAIYISLDAEHAVRVGTEGQAVSPATGLAVITSDCYYNVPTPYYWNFDFMGTFVGEVNALRRTNGAPIKAFPIRRFDITSYVEMAQPDYDAGWILDTSRSWTEVLDFFDTNSDYVCDNTDTTGDDCGGLACSNAANQSPDKCGFNYAYSASCWEQTRAAGACTGASGHEIDRYLNALGVDSRTKVQYLPHLSGIVGTTTNFEKSHPFPTEVLMDLSDISYQAYVVARWREDWNSIALWASAYLMTWKPGQYGCRDVDDKQFHERQWYIGGAGSSTCNGYTDTFATHQGYIDGGDTPWTADPGEGAVPVGSAGYGFAEYVAGFKAITDSLKDARIPMAMFINLYPWWTEGSTWDAADECGALGTSNCDFYDDPSTTTVNENDTIKTIYCHLTYAFYGTPTNPYDVQAEAEMLTYLRDTCGVTVVELSSTLYGDQLDRPVP